VQEAQDKIIVMDDDDPDCIGLMVHWMYTNFYSVGDVCTPQSIIAFNADVADMCDKYNLPEPAIAAWSCTAEHIAVDGWPDDFVADVDAVFTSGRDTKSYRQAENTIVEGFHRHRQTIINCLGQYEVSELFERNPRFGSKVAQKLLFSGK
jgi:S-adenosylmethionine/arginine decarboxylase-like enzyme